MEWSTACLDWQERLRAGQSIIPPPIFTESAEQALRVFKELRIVDAPGSPTFGASCAPWVFDLVASIFGAYDPESGRRLITEWFVCLPKKNAKSTIAAGIMMTALILNWRQSAEFAILAPTVEIAGNSFGPARDLTVRDADLNDLMHVQTHVKTITHRVSGAFLKVLAADNDTVGGKKSVGTLIDELWLFGKRPDAENMLREATGGLASRPEGFVIYLTTQSDDAPAGVFKQKLQYARDVRDGRVVDKRFQPIIYEFPPGMVKAGDHREPRHFHIVNPNLGYSVDGEFLAREFGKAQNAGEESMRGFLAKHLNVEIGLSLLSNRWAGADFWERNAEAGLTLEDVLRRSEVVTIGIDGGGLDDLFGLAVVGREASTGRWLAWCRAWAADIVLERRKSEASKLRDFEADGDLVIVGSLPEDLDGILATVQQVIDSGLLADVGIDKLGMGAIVTGLETLGLVQNDNIHGVPQGYALNGAIKTAERKLAEGTLKHAGAALMAWCVGNARVEPKGNAISITKQASGTAKIDPLMALFNAVFLMALNPEADGMGSFFDFVRERNQQERQTDATAA